MRFFAIGAVTAGILAMCGQRRAAFWAAVAGFAVMLLVVAGD